MYTLSVLSEEIPKIYRLESEVTGGGDGGMGGDKW